MLFLLALASSWFSFHQIDHVDAINTRSYMSPLQQFKTNTSISNVVCQDNLLLLMKKSDGSPACVSPSSMTVLIERGWAIHVLPEYTKEGTKNSDMFNRGPFEIKTESVNYFENTTGYIARPVKESNFPGVILIHEWWV